MSSSCPEYTFLYVAEDLRPAPREGDHTEFIEVATFPFDEVLRMVVADEIKDAMTVVAVLHAARLRSWGASKGPPTPPTLGSAPGDPERSSG